MLVARDESTRRDDPIGRVVAANIRFLRQTRTPTMTQEDLADKLAPLIGGRVTGAAIQQWEAGADVTKGIRRFSVTELWALCRVFNVPLAGLLLPSLGLNPAEPFIPDVFGRPYAEVWDNCFDGTERWAMNWRQVFDARDGQKHDGNPVIGSPGPLNAGQSQGRESTVVDDPYRGRDPAVVDAVIQLLNDLETEL
jgi:hypothetical protein